MSLRPLVLCLALAAVPCVTGATAAATGQNPPPSTRVAPTYPIPYESPTAAQIQADLTRVLEYLETSSAVRVIDRDTQETVPDFTRLPARPGLAPAAFLLTSYEWGVTYAGMLHAADATRDDRFRRYVAERLTTIATLAAHLARQPAAPADLPPRDRMLALGSVLQPRVLDDCGAMAAAMIKASRHDIEPALLRPCIDRYLAWIRSRQFRLEDGTLARNRPLPRTLWLDDLFMSVPALAQMSVLTGDREFLDDAVRQINQFSARLFVPEKQLYRHGWTDGMEPHPAFHWARANGWAVLAMAELLDVLPPDHPGRPAVLAQFRSHVAGLAALQDGGGLWHQLLDRPDSYLETSASAMFVYAIARGINRGWLDATAYGPMAVVGWNAVAHKINSQGQVEGTCIGTGMAFDPMFYYHRPTSVLAAHGYGPVLLAGAEMITLSHTKGPAVLHDGGLQFGEATGR